MLDHRTRLLAVGSAALAIAGVVVTSSSHPTSGTPPQAAAPAQAQELGQSPARSLAPIEVTVSGLDGHGPATATVTQAVAAPAAAVAPATAPAKAKVAATATQPPLQEGISVEQAAGAVTQRGLHSHALTAAAANSYDIAANGTSVFTANGIRYVYVNLKVRNAQSCSTPGTCTAYTTPVSNLSLVAAETSGTINQTAVKSMKLFSGANADPSLATQIVPTDGVIGNDNSASGSVQSDDALRSLQLFKESEVAAAPAASTVTSLLPYGFVVRNVHDGSRTLPATPAANDFEGGTTIALAFPTQSVATNNPFSISLVYQPFVDTNVRVTESVQDANPAGDADANARAAALGSGDVAVTGGSHVAETNNGDPICSVRTAGTAAAPTAYLVNTSSSALASLPYNTVLHATSGGIRAGFCAPVSTASQSALFSEFVVSGAESGQRTASGAYTGTYSAGANGTNVVNFVRGGKPFFVGEQISETLTSAVTSTPWVGSFTVGGQVPSLGRFRSASSTAAGGGPTYDATADFNGDGIPDVAVVNRTGNSVSVFFGEGDGNFTPAEVVAVGSSPYGIATGDFNNDGDADFAVANSGSNTVSVFLGTGSGTFTQAPGSPVAAGNKPVAIAAGNLTGDGNTDLAVGDNNGNSITTLQGNGDGSFVAGTIGFSTSNGQPQAIGIGDLNNDGHNDIVIATTADQVISFMSNGSGGFSASGSDIAGSSQGVGDNPKALVLADLNHDGKLDVATANEGSDNVSVLLGNGTGAVSGTTVGGNLDGPAGLAVGDFDGDGNLDLGVSNINVGSFEALYGDGTGAFNAAPGSNVSTQGNPVGVAVADLNGDDNLDAVVVNNVSNTITPLLGAGSARSFSAVISPTTPSIAFGTHPRGEAVGDFNGDGKLDLAVAGNGTVAVYLGNGAGKFTPASGSPITVGTTPYGVETADFDGDGKLDLVVSNSGSGNVQFLKGNGDGTFTSKGSISTGGQPEQVAVGDFNADGRPDLAVGNFSGQNVSILLNTGSFSFTSSILTPPAAGSVTGIAAGDLNGDGRLDLALSLSSGADKGVLVELGKGDGTFTTGSDYLLDDPQSIHVADLNGDGIPDLVTNDDSATPAVEFLAGNGDGTFTTHHLPLATGSGGYAMAVGDVNGDGVADVLAADRVEGVVHVLLGGPNGPAESAAAPPFSYAGLVAGDVELGDFFGTAKLGVAVSGYGSGTVQVFPQF